MKQIERLSKYLKSYGKINPLEAWISLGIYRLSAVIYDLRNQGWKINTTFVNVQNQFGEKINVATYVLESTNE